MNAYKRYVKVLNGDPRIPDAYQEVEWVQGGASTYYMVKLNYNSSNTYQVDCKLQVAGFASNYMFGQKQYSGMLYNGMYNSVLEFNWKTLSNWGSAVMREMTQVLNSDDTVTITINGISQTVAVGTNGYSDDFYLFGCNNGVRAYSYNIKCYSFKIHEGTDVKVDLVPCYRKSDNKTGFYDLIAEDFYTNADGYLMEKGPDVDPFITYTSYKRIINIPRLPSGYQEYNYITFPSDKLSGPIMPLVCFKDVNKIEFTYSSTNTVGSDILLGYKYDTTGWWGYGSGGSTSRMSTSGIDGYTITPDLTAAEYGDGTKRTITITYTSVSSSLTQPFTIGAYSPKSFCKTKNIYEIKCYLDNVLTNDFIPAMRLSDNEPGMYDIVTDNFHYNSLGTTSDEFILGTTTADSQITTYKTIINKSMADYVEVEYLEASGVQWIDTGYLMNSDSNTKFEFETKFRKTDSSTADTCVGGFHNANQLKLPNIYNGYFETNTPYGSLGNITPTEGVYGNDFVYNLYLTSGEQRITINDIVQKTGTSTGYSITAQTITLFGKNIGSSVTWPFTGRIYYAWFKENGSYVHNLIPMVRVADNKPGFYDETTGEFLVNRGSGVDFTPGPEVG